MDIMSAHVEVELVKQQAKRNQEEDGLHQRIFDAASFLASEVWLLEETTTG